MWLFISIQILSAVLVSSSIELLDIYRSINCLALSLRGMYCLLYTNVQISLINTCIMYISYTTTDLFLLILLRVKRVELILHHVFTIQSYIYLYGMSDYYYDAYLAHLFLIAELLSSFNALLRHTVWLKYWRRYIIIFVRIPIWMYMIHIRSLLNQCFSSQILYKTASIFLPLLDIYFLFKI
jgi:hypothetical protein